MITAAHPFVTIAAELIRLDHEHIGAECEDDPVGGRMKAVAER